MSTKPEQTSQLAQSLPGLDAAPAIATMERGLLGSLGAPTQQTLGALPLQQFAGSSEGPPANLAGLAKQIDPFGLITPVIDALGTLGTGQFSGVDPTQVLAGISKAFDGTSGPVQHALGSIANDWQGESGDAVGTKTQAALANGARVADQASGLGSSLSSAASSVAQARQQIMDIIDEFQATLAGADLSTPAGKAAAVSAANQANTAGAGIMQELQGNLGSQANQLSALGAPVAVAQTPAAAGSSMAQDAMGFLTGPNGVAAAVSAVTSDPRLTPKGLTENFMDLIFLPQTLTSLSQEMTQTNTIMTGLGNTLNKTNATIGKTNSIMTGLGTTLGQTNQALAPLPGALSQATTGIDSVGTELAPNSPINEGLDTVGTEIGPNSPINKGLDTVGTELAPKSALSKGLSTVGTEVAPNSSLVTNLHEVDGELGATNKTLGPVSSGASDLQHFGNDVKGLIP
jgi:hypothetical protein